MQAEEDVRTRAREKAKRDRELDDSHRSAKTRAWASEHEVGDDRDASATCRAMTDDQGRRTGRERGVGGRRNLQEEIQATRLRTWQNVYRLINPQVVVRALANPRRKRQSQLPTAVSLLPASRGRDGTAVAKMRTGEAAQTRGQCCSYAAIARRGRR